MEAENILLKLFKTAKIDFTKACFEWDGGGYSEPTTEITPKDFLNYSKLDFSSKSKRGNVNALSNAKRAIDCQTEKIIRFIGIKNKEFPTSINEYINTRGIIYEDDIPFVFKLIKSINFAPASLVSNARAIRNKLEHNYREPSKKEVLALIELAELFILATDYKLQNIRTTEIRNEDSERKNSIYVHDTIYISFDDKSHAFDVTYHFDKKKVADFQIDVKDPNFFFLMKLSTSYDYEVEAIQSIKDLLKYIQHPIPQANINIKIN